MTPTTAYKLAETVMGLPLATKLVDRAHLAGQAALLAQGFKVRREFRPELKALSTGHALVAGAIVEDAFTSRNLLLRTELFMTTEADSYGCAYLSWDLHYADVGPREAVEHNAALGFKHLYEGRGVDPDWPAFEAQQELLRSLAAPLSGPAGTALDFDAMALDFAAVLAAELTL